MNKLNTISTEALHKIKYLELLIDEKSFEIDSNILSNLL
jgi:hypothetical protein